MAQIRLYLLGPPRIELDGQPVQIGRSKAVALLAYLAVTATPHSREALAALLWPESAHARANLRRVLVTLRQALGEELLDVQGATVGVRSDAALWLDVHAFHERLERCHGHDHPADQCCPDCATLLAEAVALYGDDLLAGFTLPDSMAFDEWVFFQSEGLREGLASALQRLVRWHSERGEADTAIDYARRWLALDPLHEPAHRQLMTLYAEGGRRSAALRQYRECLRVLEEELGVSPAPETTALYEAIRGQTSQIEASPPPATAERVAPTMPDFLSGETAAVAARPVVFVAREAELARLDRFLARALTGHGGMAFVAGGPGRGKTALIHAFARRAMEVHPDLLAARGACNAFSGVGDPYLPFRQILGTLTGDVTAAWSAGELSPDHARRLWDFLPLATQTLLDHGPYLIDTLIPGLALLSRALTAAPDATPLLRTLRGWVERERGSAAGLEQQALFTQVTNVLCALARDHPLLLLLDDLQWADDGSIALLFHLGREVERGRILVVGAYRPEEVVVDRPAAGSGRLVPHPLGNALTEFKRCFGDVWLDLTQADATEGRRFVEAYLDSEPNRLDADFRDELFAHARGHPLFTIELLRAMQERGDLVRDAEGAWVVGRALDWSQLPTRVEAVIERRIDRVDPALRDLLAVASVEGERFSAQVLAQVQGLPEREVVRALSRELGARHRLVRAGEEVPIDPAGGRFVSRYQFAHALFQEHLYGSLSAGERRLLHGEVGTALERLYSDRTGEIVAQLAHHYAQAGQREKAVVYALRAGDRAREAFANQEALAYYGQVLAWLDEGSEETSAGSAAAAADNERRLEALLGLGRVHVGIGTVAEAEGYLRQAIALAKETGLPARQTVRLYFWLAEALYAQGRYDDEMRLGEEGLALLEDQAPSGHTEAPAELIDASLEWVLMNRHIALVHRLRRDGDKYRDLNRRIAGILERLPYSPQLRPAYVGLANARMIERDVKGALSWLQRLKERATAIQDMRGVAAADAIAGDILLQTGDLGEAISRYQRAVALFTTVGDSMHRSRFLVAGLALCYYFRGDLPKAQQMAQQGLEAARRVGLNVGRALERLGNILAGQGQWEKADQAYQEALASIPAGDAVPMAWSKLGLAWVRLAAGKAESARKYLEEALPSPGTFALGEYTESLSWGAVLGSLGGGLQFSYILLHVLERAHDDPAVFHAYCRRLSEQYSELRTSGLVQWYLEPCTAGTQCEPPLQHNPFLDALEREWRWHDSFGDCSLSVDHGLEIHAAGGRTLLGFNLSAPRVLRPTSGNWAAQTVCRAISTAQLAAGGLLLWQDAHNYLHLSCWHSSSAAVAFRGCLAGKDVLIGRGTLAQATPDGVFLRLERLGNRVLALCSVDGEKWLTAGELAFRAAGPLRIGLFADGAVHHPFYPAARRDGTTIRFESFTLWALEG